MIVQTLKSNRKIVCYIKQFDDIFIVCTGKPSDISCISWQYDNIEEAQKTANEFFNNYTTL